MYRKKAFTLIELLVVIAIIALLLSILMPALNRAKRMAYGASCLSNQKTLIMAWTMYAGDNDNKICGGNNGPDPMGILCTFCDDCTCGGDWIDWPQDETGDKYVAGCMVLGTDFVIKYEQNGLTKGTLYPYIKTVKPYHCPGDDRAAKKQNGYRTYSVTCFANGMPERSMGCTGTPTANYNLIVKSMMQIKRPTTKYVFVEEQDTGDGGRRNFNLLGWFIWPPAIKTTWGDPLAILHGDSSTLAFADGHAEKHKWMDKRTRDYFRTGDSTLMWSPNNEDLIYMVDGIMTATEK